MVAVPAAAMGWSHPRATPRWPDPAVAYVAMQAHATFPIAVIPTEVMGRVHMRDYAYVSSRRGVVIQVSYALADGALVDVTEGTPPALGRIETRRHTRDHHPLVIGGRRWWSAYSGRDRVLTAVFPGGVRVAVRGFGPLAQQRRVARALASGVARP